MGSNYSKTLGDAKSTPQDEDRLSKLPTELRLMIFEEVLVKPGSIFRGADEFGKFREKEYLEGSEVIIPAGILQTCRKYHDEAAQIMYGKNFFIFCTGYEGSSGYFDRFPISRTYMPWVREIGVFFRVTDPQAEASSKVAHFIRSISRRAVDLHQLVVCAASDRYYEHKCPFDVLWPSHPVVQALLETISRKTVQNLKIRVHDDAAFSPGLACVLQDMFVRNGPAKGQTLTFTRSCTCPKGCPIHAREGCQICGRPRQGTNEEDRPIEDVLPGPEWCEASFERMAELEDELLDLGILGAADQDEGGGEENDEGSDSGLYFPAFSSGFCYDREGNIHCHWPMEMLPRYRGKMIAPKAWLLRQTMITTYFPVILYDEYLLTLLKPSERKNEEKRAASILATAGIGPLPVHINVLEALARRKLSPHKTSCI